MGWKECGLMKRSAAGGEARSRASFFEHREMEGGNMANEETIIQLKGMGKECKTANGPVVALNDINLDIYRGEIFGIIGLSGAGKSTLVRCINMLEVPTSGQVLFEGENLAAMSEAERRMARQSMGMNPQQEFPICCPREPF